MRAKSLPSDHPFQETLSGDPTALNVHPPTSSIDFPTGGSFGNACAFPIPETFCVTAPMAGIVRLSGSSRERPFYELAKRCNGEPSRARRYVQRHNVGMYESMP